jgi:hypothetical protein
MRTIRRAICALVHLANRPYIQPIRAGRVWLGEMSIGSSTERIDGGPSSGSGGAAAAGGWCGQDARTNASRPSATSICSVMQTQIQRSLKGSGANGDGHGFISVGIVVGNSDSSSLCV